MYINTFEIISRKCTFIGGIFGASIGSYSTYKEFEYEYGKKNSDMDIVQIFIPQCAHIYLGCIIGKMTPYVIPIMLGSVIIAVPSILIKKYNIDKKKIDSSKTPEMQ